MAQYVCQGAQKGEKGATWCVADTKGEETGQIDGLAGLLQSNFQSFLRSPPNCDLAQIIFAGCRPALVFSCPASLPAFSCPAQASSFDLLLLQAVLSASLSPATVVLRKPGSRLVFGLFGFSFAHHVRSMPTQAEEIPVAPERPLPFIMANPLFNTIRTAMLGGKNSHLMVRSTKACGVPDGKNGKLGFATKSPLFIFNHGGVFEHSSAITTPKENASEALVVRPFKATWCHVCMCVCVRVYVRVRVRAFSLILQHTVAPRPV
eukprot:1157801-Pelagomonas_calceolata.AAC.5